MDETVEEPVDKSTWPMFTIVDSRRRSKELIVPVLIDGKQVDMELDTGASVTIIRKNVWYDVLAKKLVQKTDVKLRSYSGHEIPVVGEAKVQVSHRNQEALLPVIITENDGPVLMGRDWLSVLKLDWGLIKQVSTEPIDRLEALQKKYSSLLDGELGTIRGVKAHLKLKENAVPTFFKPRPVPFALKEKIAEELSRLERVGVLEKVEFSDWATPIVPVLKPDGSVRICGDYKVTINPVLDVPEHPMPTADDLFTQLNGGEKFSKLDLSSAYQQVLLDEESKQYVTINTHLGLFRYTHLPFGVASSPAIFQKVMDSVTSGLQGVGGILDDVIVTGANDEEHFRNLEGTLSRLSNMGVKLKKEKCVFMKSSVEYFAFVVDRHGIHPSPRKVQAIQEVSVPENPTELKSFLGLVNYYRRFIPDMATLVHPLNCLLAENISWKWTKQCHEAFQKLKDILQSAPLLTHYDAKKPLRLAVDASSYGLGAVLSHISDDEEKPIAFSSRTLSPSEQNYSMIEKEALAIIFGVKKFHQYLFDRRFTLQTDHKPLAFLLGPKRGIPVLAVSRLQRWSIQLAAYQYDIEYRASKNHANADALSRLPRKTAEKADDWTQEADQVNRVQVERAPITVPKIREATRGDPALSRAMYYILHRWPTQDEIPEELKVYYNKQDEFTVEDGCLLRGTRVVIPAKYQPAVLSELHLNDPGMVRMKSLARLHVWWPSMDDDVEQTVRDCPDCQANRSKSPSKITNSWIWPSRPWQRIHVDFAGPFNGGMFLIVVDAKSKWIEVFPMSTTTASATIQALRFLFATHGLPEEIVSDNGPQFVAQEMKEFLKSNGIRQCLSSPYHPASNGEAVRAVRTFKQAMKTMKAEPGTQAEKLARFLLGYRTTPHTATGCTPAELLMGRRIRTRLDILHPDLSSRISKKSKTADHSTPRVFDIGEPVMVKDYRDRNQPWIKGVIQDRLEPVTYRVQVGYLFWKRHVDQLRSLAGSKVADKTDQEPLDETPLSVPLSSSEPVSTTNGSRGPPSGQFNLPVSPLEQHEEKPDSPPSSPVLSQGSATQTTEVPASTPQVNRYPTRVREKSPR